VEVPFLLRTLEAHLSGLGFVQPRVVRRALLLVATIGCVAASSAAAHSVEIVRSGLPGLYDVTRGPGGALWMTRSSPPEIGRLGSNGHIRWFRAGLESVRGLGSLITSGGSLWFTGSGVVGRMTPVGDVRLWREGLASGYEGPVDLTAAPDGSVWFFEGGDTPGSGHVGRIAHGALTLFDTVAKDATGRIVLGFDGRLWVTSLERIERINLDGTAGPPVALPPNHSAASALTAAHGRVYVGLSNAVLVLGRDGSRRLITLGSRADIVFDIGAAPDGRIWAALSQSDRFASFASNGSDVRHYGPGVRPDTGPGGLSPWRLAPGPQNSMWFVGGGNSALGRITLRTRDCAVPRLTGFRTRAARRRARSAGCRFEPHGVGRFVIRQTPAAGRVFRAGWPIAVRLGPRPPACAPPPGGVIVARSGQAVVIRRERKANTAGDVQSEWWGCLVAHPRLRLLERFTTDSYGRDDLLDEQAAGRFVAARLVSRDHYGDGSDAVLIWDLATGRRSQTAWAASVDGTGGIESEALGPQGAVLWVAQQPFGNASVLTLARFDGTSRELARGAGGSITSLRVTRDAATWIQDGVAQQASLSR
jgi:virginiamycin B lyase